MGIDTGELFPIWLPVMNDIAEMVSMKKRQFPGALVGICKRYIGNAFKRVPLHPDYVAIFPPRLTPCAMRSMKIRHWVGRHWISGFQLRPPSFRCGLK